MLRFFAMFVALALLALGCSNSTRRAPGRVEGTNPGECSDGADNDADGYFDCGDSDCARAPACADGAVVVMDSDVPDGTAPDSSTTPDASAPDSTTRPDTAPPPDSSAPDSMTRPDTTTPPTCNDAEGTWEAITDCPLLPMGERLVITRTGPCEYSVSGSSGSGTATVDGMDVTLMITDPLPLTCMGTVDGDFFTTDCGGCTTELRRL